MGILYDVPRFSERTTSQKGPTCWYYSTKMLLKFHDLFDRGAKDAANPLETLHALRKLLTPTAHGQARDIYSVSRKQLRHPLDARLAQLRKERADLNALPPADDPMMAYLRQQGKDAVATQIAAVKEMMQKTADPAKMKGVTRLVEKMIEEEVTRYDFLSFALPDIKFRRIDKPKSAEALELSLRIFGPIYASGSLTIAATNKDDTSGRSGSKERVVAVKELGGDGRHAVVIAGVTDQEAVFYKDPNQADELKCIHFRHFVANQPKLRMLAIECASRGKPDESRRFMADSCLHCVQRVITQDVAAPASVAK